MKLKIIQDMTQNIISDGIHLKSIQGMKDEENCLEEEISIKIEVCYGMMNEDVMFMLMYYLS